MNVGRALALVDALEHRVGAPLLRARRAVSFADVLALRLLQDVVDPASYRVEDIDQRLADFGAAEELYRELDPAIFYREPPRLQHLHERRVRRVADGEVLDLTWPSGHIPHALERMERYRAHARNHCAHVRWFRHREPSPTIVCVHGYRGGAFRLEELLWPVSRLYAFGLDVALFTLPFHGRRAATELPGPVLFPSNRDLFLTVEGFGQAIWDLRQLVTWLRHQHRAPVGLAGMSLGGYVAALLATIEPDLDFVIPYIPLAEFSPAFQAHLRLRGREVPEPLLRAGERAMRLCRPLTRAPRVPAERVLVIGAEHDLITGRVHAELLAAHFGSELLLVPGTHMLHLGRRRALAAMQGFLRGLGVLRTLH